jgi:hypothetical protein
MKYKTKVVLIIVLIFVPFSMFIPKVRGNFYYTVNASESYRVSYGSFNAWVEVTLNVQVRIYVGGGEISFHYSSSVRRSGLPWYAYWLRSSTYVMRDGKPISQDIIFFYDGQNRYTTTYGRGTFQYWTFIICSTVHLYPHIVFDENTGNFYGITVKEENGHKVAYGWFKFLSRVPWSDILS